jgi:hypothetical protein
LRNRLLPDWSGPPARLAEVVIALAIPFAVAQILGTFGWFERWPVFAGVLVVAGVVTALGRGPVAASRRVTGAGRREEIVVAVGATAVVVAQWVMHTADALGRGMTHGDTLWYHGPFAARFVQTGYLTHASSTGLEGLATPLHWSLPLNGSLAHAMLVLPFDHDIVSPVLNLGFLALGLLAGWCIGARHGAGALALLATVVVLGLPTLTGTQPGQASNDVVTSVLYLTAIALLFESELRPAPVAIAAVAAGLGLGTKLTVLAPLAVVTIGVIVVAWRARKPVTAVAWCVALFCSGSYWLIRNWVVFGNPVPWSEVSLGPLHLDRAMESRPALVTLLDQWDTWDEFVFPGLRDALGRGWIVVLVLAVGGAIAGVVRPRIPLGRVAGLASLAGIVALPFIPFSADFGGGIFVFIVRYLVPEFVVGVLLGVLVVIDAPVLWRRVLVAVFAVLVVSDVTSEYIEGAELWPSGYAAAGVIAALAMIGIAAAMWWYFAEGRAPAGPVAIGAGSVAVIAVAVLAGWFVQRDYLDQRYVDAGLPNDNTNESFRDVHDARVASIARDHFYPLFGLDLSNDVELVEGPRSGSDVERCRAWRRMLDGYDFVVLGSDPFAPQRPDPAWIADDPAVSVALVDGDETVYRVRGPLDPRGCA